MFVRWKTSQRFLTWLRCTCAPWILLSLYETMRGKHSNLQTAQTSLQLSITWLILFYTQVCEKSDELRRRRKKNDSLNFRCKLWDNRFTILVVEFFDKMKKKKSCIIEYLLLSLIYINIPVFKKLILVLMSYQAKCKIVFSHWKVILFCCEMLVIWICPSRWDVLVHFVMYAEIVCYRKHR